MTQTLLRSARRALTRTALACAALTVVAAAPAAAQETGGWHLVPLRGEARTVRDSAELTLTRGPDQLTTRPVVLARLRGLTPEALNGAPASAQFALAAEAGTISFTGRVGGGTGDGTFRFVPNGAFADALRRYGVQGRVDASDLLRLALHGTRAGDVQATATALRRYDDVLPDGGELVRLENHGVDAHVIADLGDAGLRGLTPADLIRLVNHEIDGRYVRAVRAAGHAATDVNELVYLRKHAGGRKKGAFGSAPYLR